MHQATLTRRQREKIEHRRQMLEVALELFALRGYHNVSMHEIAEKAEFAIGTIYKFFKNKEDLYNALLREKGLAYQTAMLEILERPGPALVILREYLQTDVTFFYSNIPMARLYFIETKGFGRHALVGFDSQLREICQVVESALETLINRAIDEGCLKPGNPRFMTLALIGIMQSFLFSILDQPTDTAEKIDPDMILDIFLKGCGAP